MKSLAITTGVLTLLVAALVAYIQAEKIRLDLYNRRFDIYKQTLGFYHTLEHLEESYKDGTFFLRLADFTIACRESRFLFRPESGVYDLLNKLHTETAKITGVREAGPQLQPSLPVLLQMTQDKIAAMNLWIKSVNPLELEARLEPYLNFRYISILSSLVDKAQLLWKRLYRRGSSRS